MRSRGRSPTSRRPAIAVDLAASTKAKPADVLMARSPTEIGASTIVVGTVGENPISGAILGSVVLKLVQRSTVPLLIVPTREG